MTANEYCNRMGMDTISASGVVAFAMEAFEKGIITTEDTGGYAIEWGDGDVLMKILTDMVEGRNIGKVLACGVREAARILGKGSEEFAVHVKGMEPAMHDPRAYTSMAPEYALASRGADHLEGMSYLVERGIRFGEYGIQEDIDPKDDKNKVEAAYTAMRYLNMFNALGLCKFIIIGKLGPATLAEWVNAVTGWDTTAEELLTASDRLVTEKRMYNMDRGITEADDTLCPRLMQPRPDGPAADRVPDVKAMVRAIYLMRGWDEHGVPTPETLDRLGLSGRL
jgi:aldehyde:ferredoxin oxidoreductase